MSKFILIERTDTPLLRFFLCIQETSVAAERVFLTVGLIFITQRSRIDPGLINQF